MTFKARCIRGNWWLRVFQPCHLLSWCESLKCCALAITGSVWLSRRLTHMTEILILTFRHVVKENVTICCQAVL